MKSEGPEILMLGWEFPPEHTGGLGTVTYGLSKELLEVVDLSLILPTSTYKEETKKIAPEEVKLIPLNAEFKFDPYKNLRMGEGKGHTLKGNRIEKVRQYAQEVLEVTENLDFDLIHAHDWLTGLAGAKLKEKTGKPFIFHVHSTIFDRAGGSKGSGEIYDIEKEVMGKSDKLITVSKRMKKLLHEKYGIKNQKIEVIYNAPFPGRGSEEFEIEKDEKVVLFFGRVTLHKGPDYFIRAAHKVVNCGEAPECKFILAGKGDMLPQVINEAIGYGIGDKVMFTGYLDEEDVDQAYQMADVYVMPSVSDPFGITAIESLKNGTPVIISKECGVTEALDHVLKVNFWDVNDIANKIIAALKYGKLKDKLKKEGKKEAKRFTWESSTEKCLKVYREVLKN